MERLNVKTIFLRMNYFSEWTKYGSSSGAGSVELYFVYFFFPFLDILHAIIVEAYQQQLTDVLSSTCLCPWNHNNNTNKTENK